MRGFKKKENLEKFIKTKGSEDTYITMERKESPRPV